MLSGKNGDCNFFCVASIIFSLLIQARRAGINVPKKRTTVVKTVETWHRQGAWSATPRNAVWFSSQQLRISLVKQSRCAATESGPNYGCVSSTLDSAAWPRLAPALCSKASGGVWGGPGRGCLTPAVASERDGSARWVSRWTRGLSRWSAVQAEEKNGTITGDRGEKGKQHKGRDARWGSREKETEENGTLPDPCVDILTAISFTVADFPAANRKLQANRWFATWFFERLRQSGLEGGYKAFWGVVTQWSSQLHEVDGLPSFVDELNEGQPSVLLNGVLPFL